MKQACLFYFPFNHDNAPASYKQYKGSDKFTTSLFAECCCAVGLSLTMCSANFRDGCLPRDAAWQAWCAAERPKEYCSFVMGSDRKRGHFGVTRFN